MSRYFGGEIAPCDHVVQIYENDEAIIDSLEGFVTSGFTSGDSVIIIATKTHLTALNERIKKSGFDIKKLKASRQYIPLDAEETLARFMVNGWPDDSLFRQMVSDLVKKARGKKGRRVRAYGEMVAILWGNGQNGATVHLEYLWNQFCNSEAFCLFCAYPKSGFTTDVNNSLKYICSTHSKVIESGARSATEIFYRLT